MFPTQRLARETGAAAIFMAVSAVIFDALMPDGLEEYGFAALLTLLLAPRIAYTVLCFLLTPNVPQHRLVFADNTTAKSLTRHTVGMAVLIGAMQIVSQFNALNSAPEQAALTVFWFDLALRAYFVWIVIRCWTGLVLMMRGANEEVGVWENRIARIFPSLAIVGVFGTWWLINIIASYDALALLAERPDITTVGLLVAAPAFHTLIRALVSHLMPPMSCEGPIAENAYHETGRASRRIGRILVFGAILLQLADIWYISSKQSPAP